MGKIENQPTFTENVSQAPYYQIHVTALFLINSFVICVTLAFGIGQLASKCYVQHIFSHFNEKELYKTDLLSTDFVEKDISDVVTTIRRSITTESLELSSLNADYCVGESNQKENDDDDDDDDDDETDLVLSLDYNVPGSGQMLIMEVDSVAVILPVEEIMSSLKSIFESADWKLLSYHCNGLKMNTKSHCIGILSNKAHFAIMVQPAKKSLIFTLFTSSQGSQLMLDLVPKFKDLFVSSTEDEIINKLRDLKIKWKVRYRGYDNYVIGGQNNRDPYHEDLGYNYIGAAPVHLQKIKTVESDFQLIDIYDVLDPSYTDFKSYSRSMSNDGSYYSLNPELFSLDRVVFLDGVIQSSSRGDEAYHEALVHPAMFAHPNPKRVAIIGGGEGATLREVLKHSTLEHVKMIDIDEIMVKVSDEFLPKWNDCTDLLGVNDDCFKDDRADVLYEDAMAWFIDRFSVASSNALFGTEQQFDVIIMDALDPQDTVVFARILYSSDTFVKSLLNGLTKDGVLVMQLGEVSTIDDPPDQHTRNKSRAILMEIISQIGFQRMHIYQEAHCRFLAPWTFLVACKSTNCGSSWDRNAPQTELSIHKRIRRSISGNSLLKYFDSATMSLYHSTPKAFETLHCRATPIPRGCDAGRGYVKGMHFFSSNSFEIKPTQDGSALAVYAKVDIPSLSYIETGVPFYFPPNVRDLIRASPLYGNTAYPSINVIPSFLDSFGTQSSLQREYERYASPGIHSLFNQNCGKESNVGDLASWTLNSVKSHQHFSTENKNEIEAPYVNTNQEYFSIYSPVFDRHVSSFVAGFVISLRDIKAGDELKKACPLNK